MSKIILLIILLSMAISACDKTGTEKPVVKAIGIGSPAVDFTLRDSSEKNVSLSEYKGRVVLLNFWNMKCKDCTESMPSLEALNQRFKGQGLEVMTINADNLEYVKPDAIVSFIKSKGYTFRLLFDETFSTSESYKIVAIPVNILIDKKGTVSFIKYGKDDWTSSENIERVQRLLNQ